MKFQNLIKSIILEDARLEHLLKTHAHKDIVKVNQKDGKKKVKKAPLTPKQMMIIVANDPTSRIEGIEPTQVYEDSVLEKISPDQVKKTGEYSQWMIKQYKSLVQKVETPYGEPGYERELSEKQRLFFEDLYKTKEDLIKFHRFKNTDKIKEADINKYDIRQLEQAVSGLSLELATTTKEERKSSMLHPGAEFMFETPKWYVVKMSRNDELGKEAAIFYGGSQRRSSEGETNWCTSAPGLNYYFNYLRQGPYYVIIDKTDEKMGNVSGLPAHRYQFHFESNQFMDVDDRQINFVKFFNDNPDLKENFKSIIVNHFSSDKKNGTTVEISYPSDGISKIIGLYGFEDFFNNLAEDLQTFEFEYSPNRGYGRSENTEAPKLDIPASISRFKSLTHLYLENCVASLPESIGDLKNLQILGLPKNQGIKLPNSIAKLIDNGLMVLLISDTGLTEESLSEPIKKAIERRQEKMMNEGGEPFMLVS